MESCYQAAPTRNTSKDDGLYHRSASQRIRAPHRRSEFPQRVADAGLRSARRYAALSAAAIASRRVRRDAGRSGAAARCQSAGTDCRLWLGGALLCRARAASRLLAGGSRIATVDRRLWAALGRLDANDYPPRVGAVVCRDEHCNASARDRGAGGFGPAQRSHAVDGGGRAFSRPRRRRRDRSIGRTASCLNELVFEVPA